MGGLDLRTKEACHIAGGVKFISREGDLSPLNSSKLGDALPPLQKVDDPDGDLIDRIAVGDHAAVRELLDRYLPKMVAVARRMLGTQEDAEEVAQEVFLRVWRHAGSWVPGKAKFATWMHRVAMNLCYDRLRKKREVVLDEVPERIDDAPNPIQALHESQVARRVDKALHELPERQRGAIILCHYQNLSNIEAAQVMEISIEALESLLSRGRRGLKAKLLAEAPDLVGSMDV